MKFDSGSKTIMYCSKSKILKTGLWPGLILCSFILGKFIIYDKF